MMAKLLLMLMAVPLFGAYGESAARLGQDAMVGRERSLEQPSNRTLQNESFCSNGIPGVQYDDICCGASCSQCGGPGCGKNGKGNECCIRGIRNVGNKCTDTNEAPCIITDDSSSRDSTDTSDGAQPYGRTYEGEGTYYGFTTDGNCAITNNGKDLPSIYDGMIPVAIGGGLYGTADFCGACIEGSGTGVGTGADPIQGHFKAYVSDKCPECADSDLDFSESGDGRWDITWNFVECPNAGDPSFVFEGSNDYYWKIQPRGTVTPVERMRMNGQFDGAKTDDNFFEFSQGGPFQDGQIVETWTINGDYFHSTVTRN